MAKAKTAETVEQVMKNGNEAMKEGMESVTKAFERFSGFGKSGFEAWMQSATAMTKAFEKINGEWVSFGKQQMEDGVAAFKAVAGAKSVHEAWEVQTDFAKSALDAYVAQATKVNDLYMDAAKKAFEPFNTRFSKFANEVAEDVRHVSPFGRAAE
jgi:phasin family protein